MGKQLSNKIDMGQYIGYARLILKSGVMRAGEIITWWDDAVMIEDAEGQTGIIFRDAIAEMWQGLGTEGQETTPQNTEQVKE